MKLRIYTAIALACLLGSTAIAAQSQDSKAKATQQAKEPSSYSLVVHEKETPPGYIKPKKWLSVAVIFPTQPSEKIALNVLFTEADALTKKNMDFHIYVSVGNAHDKSTWQQMSYSKGGYLSLDYDVEKKLLARRGKMLKRPK